MSWYKAPVRTNWLLAPILLAASAARFATCIECWKVPGAISDIFLSRLLLILESSTNVTLEVNPNVFSSKNSSG